MSLLSRLLAPRLLNLLAFLTCVVAMAVALVLQYIMDLEPCPLCIFQRVAVIAAALIFLIAFLHGPRAWGRRVYALLALLAVGTGGGIAIRHLWLQSLPADQVPSCGPGLDYMLDVFPFHNVISMVLQGSGECAAVHGHFLGLTLPGWTLILFVGLASVSLWQLLRPHQPAACCGCQDR